MTYTIYYGTLPNGRRKIGVTTNLVRRIQSQKLTDHSVLEVHTDIYEASVREQELQRLYNVKVDDAPFYVSYNLGKLNIGRVHSQELIARRTSHLIDNVHAKGFKHTDTAKQAISEAVNNRPIIECPNCKKVMKGNSKFKQHYNSARCKKAALQHEQNIHGVSTS